MSPYRQSESVSRLTRNQRPRARSYRGAASRQRANESSWGTSCETPADFTVGGPELVGSDTPGSGKVCHLTIVDVGEVLQDQQIDGVGKERHRTVAAKHLDAAGVRRRERSVAARVEL